MINFSKQSWHYKLYVKKYGDWGSMPQTICPYFWKVVWALVFTYIFTPVAFVVGFSFVSVAVLVLFALPWIGLNVLLGHSADNPLWGVPIFHWKAILICLGFYSGIFGVAMVCYWFKCEYERKLSKLKENPSVFAEWAKAKKSKMCPMIKFKD